MKPTAIPFSMLHNFSLKSAFANGAIPALVGASQGVNNGSASFASISVTSGAGTEPSKGKTLTAPAAPWWS